MTLYKYEYADETAAELERLLKSALPDVELPETIQYSLFRRHDEHGSIIPYIDVLATFHARFGEGDGSSTTDTGTDDDARPTFFIAELTTCEPEPPEPGEPRKPATFILESVEYEEEWPTLHARIWTPETGEWRDEPCLRENPPLPEGF